MISSGINKFKNQTPEVRRVLKIYDINLTSTNQERKKVPSTSPSLAEETSVFHDPSSCSDSACTNLICTQNKSSSSGTNSRMRNLNNFADNPGNPRYTGTHSHSSLDWSRNADVPLIFWTKHDWADKTAIMLSPYEFYDWVSKKQLEHLVKDIAPWITTAWPVNIIDRRYWTYHHDDGTTFVSRTCAQSKQFFLKGKPIDPLDKCVICLKLLVSEYHIFMPVYEYQDSPSKSLIWEWQDSRLKACYIHFHDEIKSEFIPGRNPNSLGKRQKHSRNFFDEQQNTTNRTRVTEADLEVPDNY